MKFLTKHVTEWLIVLLSYVLIALIFSFSIISISLIPEAFRYLLNPFPYTTIIGLDTISAIGIFSGDEPLMYEFNVDTISMLINVLLYLVLGPYLLIRGYKKAKETVENNKPWYWYLGGLLVLTSISSMPIVISHIIIFENVQEQTIKSRNLDMMRSELYDVGFEIAQYEILEDGINQSFTLDDLNLDNLKYNYSVDAIESDTLIKITSTSREFEGHTAIAEIKPYSRYQIRLIR